MKIKIINKSKHPLPQYQTQGSSGMDLRANLDKKIILKSLERTLVPTGIYIELPQGYEAQIRARSGLALKKGLSLPNGIGTIDSDYRGELKIIFVNLGKEDIEINDGDRIAQMVIMKIERPEIEEVEILGDTERSKGGFGHTGL
ncbi:dUTP diphosphatase [Peptoniphilus lacrimalis]|uniref:dUTP diphosphatase n=1 Tax=Peptoniphilus lacrimalis TaxID=33031 RepID=UPI00254E02A9|nr:dUTP diphosphatase [Peptoniphilus lacrimalis]MDK7722023.1 dUTP diphosphatase [Peptoniphilus lacrimalis]MDK7731731.1 dUTP diphosphatase [Peptoniphilus lacrimalis]MDK8282160.1 dUTP diphosphatase [Peptoniphilus lacrimalis]